MKARFHSYSPGVGPLVFHWQDHDTEGRYSIGSKPVRPYMIRDYLKSRRGKGLEGYQIHKIESRWTCLKPVERVDERTLRMDGKLYRYRITSEVTEEYDLWPNSIRFEFKPDHQNLQPGWWKLRNLSMLNGLTHFLRYEPILEQTRYQHGRAIKDKDTWTPKRKWEVTTFPDGDGNELPD